MAKSTCNELCKNSPKRANYIDGYKRCSSCERFIKTEENNCFCCGMILRSKPSAGIRRQRYHQNSPPHRN